MTILMMMVVEVLAILILSLMDCFESMFTCGQDWLLVSCPAASQVEPFESNHGVGIEVHAH
jgi:hypothetical protein